MQNNGYTRYRIGVINDFRNETSFVDFQQYLNGEVKCWNASKCSTTPDYQKTEDAIHIFLNFDKLFVVKFNSEARTKIVELIKNAPVDLSAYVDYLIKA